MAISSPDVITRYFAAKAARDFDTQVTLFADDAIVIDDGQTSRVSMSGRELVVCDCAMLHMLDAPERS